MRLCTETNCGRKYLAKGMCARHYYATVKRDPVNERRFELRHRLRDEWPEEWNDKKVFRAAVGEQPGPGYRLLRKDRSKPLSADNLHWVPPIPTTVRNQENLQQYHRESHMLRKFGLTPERHAEMLARQGGVCAICRNPPTVRFKGAKPVLVVDHCHQTGRVRGLLCNQCNVAIAQFRDNPANMLAAIVYLSAGKVS